MALLWIRTGLGSDAARVSIC
eukprot:gene27338-biopygen17833